MSGLTKPIAIDQYPLNLTRYITEPVIERTTADLHEIFADGEAARKQAELVYRVYNIEAAPGVSQEMAFGITELYPGAVGEECFMTRGHFHVGNGAEMYIGMEGHGLLLLLTRNGDKVIQEIRENTIAYVPSGYAHRTVNTGEGVFKFLSVWPTGLEHDYETIRLSGFGCRVYRDDQGPKVVHDAEAEGAGPV